MRNQYRDLIKLYADREYTGKSISLDNVSHSRIRELEILGETSEIGAGEKSPSNPFTLVGAVSPAVTVNGQTLPMVSKNLYNLDNISKYAFLTVNDNIINFIPFSTTETGKWLLFAYEDKSNYMPETKYTIVLTIIEADMTGEAVLQITSNRTGIGYSDDNITDVPIKVTFESPTTYKQTFVTQRKDGFESAQYAFRQLLYLPPNTAINSLKIQISIYRADDIDLDTFTYEPYQDTFELNSVGNVADTYNPITGEYVQRVGKLVFDGTEDWTEIEVFQNTRRFVTQKIAEFVKKVQTIKDKANLICSHYNTLSVSDISSGASGIGIGTSGSLSVRDSYLYASEFKTFLTAQYAAGTPVTVIYELAEPITTTINQTNLKANIPNTTINLTEANNLGSLWAVLQTKGE